MRLELEYQTNAPVVTLEESNGFHPEPGEEASDLVKKGIAAAQKGDREQARELLTHAADIDPAREDAWMWLASISDYPEELLAFLNKVLSLNPDNSRAAEWHAATRSLLAKTFVERGITAHNDNAADLANSFFDQALEHDAKLVVAWLWKARLADNDEAKVDYLKRALELEPDNHEAKAAIAPFLEPTAGERFEEAKWAAVAGNRTDALQLLDVVLEKAPENAEAWVLRSHLSLSLDDKLAALEHALSIDPANDAARAGYDFLKATVQGAHAPVREEIPKPMTPVDEESTPTSVEITADPFEQFADEAAVDVKSEEFTEPSVEPVIETSEETVMETPVQPPIEPPVEPVIEPPVEPFIDPSAPEYQAEQPAAEAPRSVEEIFGGSFDPVDPETLTVDCIDATAFIQQCEESAPEAVVVEAVAAPATDACAFCSSPVDAQAFECANCNAVLTLSDIEALLANSRVDRSALQQAVGQMEADSNFREFDVHELTVLGIGQFNLRRFDEGLKCLQEASRLDPNNVILAGQVNALAIRVDEIRRQDEIDEGKPKGKSILVVDDSPTVRKLISAKLEKCGHNVTCAADGVEGLAMLENGLPDLVLLDIAMPRLDGYEVCRQIRSDPAAAGLPVVMISGKDGFFDKVRGKMAGCTGYVTKPFGPETLMKALETYLLPANGHAE